MRFFNIHIMKGQGIVDALALFSLDGWLES